MKKIGVIGAGAWGTALALVAARAGGQVSLFTRQEGLKESQILTANEKVLPGIVFDTAEKEHPATIKCIVGPCNCYGVLCCESQL